MNTMCRVCGAVSLHLCFWCFATYAGTVATDGSLGRARTLSGPNFTIGAGLGQQRGGNLFHSFSALNLDRGESATFIGPTSIRTVFARVTGGQRSNIDGTLRCTIPNADFYLVNPDGVVFGPNAALDVKGSFAVTTAGAIKLGSSGSFSASRSAPSSLTTAAPAAFGFLGARPAAVQLRQAVLQVPDGKTLTLAAGTVRLDNAALVAPNGQVNVAAAGASSRIPVSFIGGGAAQSGTIEVSNASTLFAEGPGGGRVVFRGGELLVTGGSSIQAGTSGAGDSRGIDLEIAGLALFADGSGMEASSTGRGRAGDLNLSAGELRITNGSSLESATLSSGRGGDINVSSSRLVVDGAGQSAGLLTDTTGQRHAGAAGDILIRSREVRVLAGGQVTALSDGAGAGGSVNVRADDIVLDDRGGAGSTTIGALSQGTGAAGPAGDVTVITRNVLRILDGATLNTTTFTSAPGGTVSVAARSIVLDRGRSTQPTGIFANAEGTGAGGTGGDVRVHAGDLHLTRGAGIGASTFGPAAGGQVNVSADRMFLIGAGRIAADTVARNGGPGGAVNVHAGELQLTGGASIEASTGGTGRGGNVSVSAQQISIDGAGQSNPLSTGFFADSNGQFVGSGDGGAVRVVAGDLRLTNEAAITAATFGSGNAGNIIVNARQVFLDRSASLNAVSVGGGNAGNIKVRARILLEIKGHAAISTQANVANAGGIEVISGGSIVLDDSFIAAEAARSGGDIRLTAPVFIRLKHNATIRTDSVLGNGGNIAIDPLVLSLASGSTIDANGSRNGGNISIAATALLGARANPGLRNPNVTATGTTGVSGSINAGPANSDVARSLARLPTDLQAAALTLQPQCGQVVNISTFLIQGRGSTPEAPGFWQQDLDLGTPLPK